MEARFDAATLDLDMSREVRQEQGRFMALHLAMLNGRAVMEVVQLYGLVGRSTRLIRCGFFAEPEVDVVIEMGSVSVSIKKTMNESPLKKCPYCSLGHGTTLNFSILQIVRPGALPVLRHCSSHSAEVFLQLISMLVPKFSRFEPAI